MKDEKRGRPSGFSKRIAAKIISLSEEGKTVEQIADILGISERTLYYWFKSDKEFLQSIKEARHLADEMVEASLFRRAIGYTHKETKFVPSGNEVVPIEIDKHYPPSEVACIFWLKNRRPTQWRDKTEKEISGDESKPVMLKYKIEEKKEEEKK